MEVQKIEGISPDMLWTFVCVLVGLAALFVLAYKVVEIVRKEHDRKKSQEKLDKLDVTDKIAEKVNSKITPQLDEKFKKFDRKFEDIDRKLANDKAQLELHTVQLNQQIARVDRLENDSKAMCHGIFALLSHEINGNSVDKLQKTHDAMRDYLIDGKYREEDWK